MWAICHCRNYISDTWRSSGANAEVKRVIVSLTACLTISSLVAVGPIIMQSAGLYADKNARDTKDWTLHSSLGTARSSQPVGFLDFFSIGQKQTMLKITGALDPSSRIKLSYPHHWSAPYWNFVHDRPRAAGTTWPRMKSGLGCVKQEREGTQCSGGRGSTHTVRQRPSLDACGHM